MFNYPSVPTVLFLCAMGTYTASAQVQNPLVRPENPSSRRVVLKAISGPISGSYPLYDLLSASTVSGSISVDVTPYSASTEEPSQPASLDLRALSGSVHATLTEPAAGNHPAQENEHESGDPPSYWEAVGGTEIGFPTRDYITSVSTHSGSISGAFPLGIETKLESWSGTLSGIEFIVMPVNSSAPRTLKTVSRDGSQRIKITDDSFPAALGTKAWWDGMVSKHDSYSGSIDVEYPDSWEGTIEVTRAGGSVTITGRGVEIIRDVGGKVIARKGKEDGGKVMAHAMSGSVNLRFG